MAAQTMRADRAEYGLNVSRLCYEDSDGQYSAILFFKNETLRAN